MCMTILRFGLKIKKMSKDVIDQKVMKMLKLIGLEGFENKDVTLLSGGQQQRVAIARALVNEPSVLLLDEPLSALDLKLRKEMQYELKKIQQEVGITFIFVTHDQEEALTMSDKIVIMKDGEIQQLVVQKIFIMNQSINMLRSSLGKVILFQHVWFAIRKYVLMILHLIVSMLDIKKMNQWMS